MSEPVQPDWDWRRMNEEAGLLASDDCRHCSGMGRVPVGTKRGASGFEHAAYANCPVCQGTGKRANAELRHREIEAAVSAERSLLIGFIADSLRLELLRLDPECDEAEFNALKERLYSLWETHSLSEFASVVETACSLRASIAVTKAVTEEREACAQIAEAEARGGEYDSYCCAPLAEEIASAIRARGEAK